MSAFANLAMMVCTGRTSPTRTCSATDFTRSTTSRDRMSPKGHGLYTVEIAHSRHRPLPKESLQARVVADLIRIEWLRSTSQVTFLRERRHTTAYALPLIGSAKVSAAVRRCLEALDIHSVGRFGEWKYSNMEDALIDGRAAVDRVMAGTAARVPR